MAIEIQDNSFDSEVIHAEKDVIVDFYSPSCVPCSMVDKTLTDVEKELGDTVKIVKVNIFKAPEAATRFSVMSVPTVMSFTKGRIKGCLVGSRKCKDYIEMIRHS
jgi:thioredoxin 1